MRIVLIILLFKIDQQSHLIVVCNQYQTDKGHFKYFALHQSFKNGNNQDKHIMLV